MICIWLLSSGVFSEDIFGHCEEVRPAKRAPLLYDIWLFMRIWGGVCVTCQESTPARPPAQKEAHPPLVFSPLQELAKSIEYWVWFILMHHTWRLELIYGKVLSPHIWGSRGRKLLCPSRLVASDLCNNLVSLPVNVMHVRNDTANILFSSVQIMKRIVIILIFINCTWWKKVPRWPT